MYLAWCNVRGTLQVFVAVKKWKLQHGIVMALPVGFTIWRNLGTSVGVRIYTDIGLSFT